MDELQKKEAEKQEKYRIRKVIGGNLNLELERLGYTQYEAAKKCGLPRQTVNKLVNGGTVIDEVKIVALDGIGISIANLFKGLVREEPQPEESADGIINQYPSDYLIDHQDMIIESMKKSSPGKRFDRLIKLIMRCLEELNKLKYFK